jgi:uncharacterized protein YeeX (DUF496 family)
MAPVYTFFEDSLSKPKCGCTKRLSEEIVYNDLTSTQNYKPRGNLDKASRMKYYQMLDNFMTNCGKIPSIIHHEEAKDFGNLMHLVDLKKSSDKSIEGDFIIVHLIYQGAKWNKAGQNVTPQYFEVYFQVNTNDMKQIYEALDIAKTAIKILDEQKPRVLGTGTFVCPLCEYHYTRKQGLYYHLNIHLSIKRFRCQGTDVNGEVCGKGFNHSDHFKEHLEKNHTGLFTMEDEKKRIAISITYEKVIRLAIGRLNIHNAFIEIDHIDYEDRNRQYEIDAQALSVQRRNYRVQNCSSQHCQFLPKDSNQMKETMKVKKPTSMTVANQLKANVKVEKPRAITVANQMKANEKVEKSTGTTVANQTNASVKVEKPTAITVANQMKANVKVENGVAVTCHKIEPSDYSWIYFTNTMQTTRFMIEEAKTRPLQTPSDSSITKNEVKRNQQKTYLENKKTKLSHSGDKENKSPNAQHELENSSRLMKQMTSVHMGEELFVCEICGLNFSHKNTMIGHITSFHKMLL